MQVFLIHPYWHKVVSTDHSPVMAVEVDGNYREVGGTRFWPVGTCTVVDRGEVVFPKKVPKNIFRRLIGGKHG